MCVLFSFLTNCNHQRGATMYHHFLACALLVGVGLLSACHTAQPRVECPPFDPPFGPPFGPPFKPVHYPEPMFGTSEEFYQLLLEGMMDDTPPPP